jgi:hypothetical protein
VKGEDKDYSCPSHSNENEPDVSSFGIFDGHFGSTGKVCCINSNINIQQLLALKLNIL